MDRPWRLPSYALLVVLAAAVLVAPGSHARTPRCPDGVLHVQGAPDACVHADSPPAGVDVHDAVSTAALRTRPGAGPRAYQAAQDLGVPGTYATTATSSAVTCDGDGTSGARVQAMYVVEAGRTNRYLDLLPSLQLWAAGVDDVLNRSAALTGGARSVRYVTDTVNGSCVARVLNVTVPTGATASFSATVSAVQALGYSSPARKYLMWTDATLLCGIASMYPDETASQANLNNGRYAQYARVDSGCWGLGNGTNQHSVEAHELTHTLGGVQYQAPHSTKAGHCWDEADTMCYADGGTHAMVSVCPAEREYLLDCNSDDYFSTYPTGYLATAWDSANSQFLVGGGNGTSGGTLGAPTSLGGTLAVNNPAVPGLPTQASVSPELPSARTLTSVAWRSGRSDCTVTAGGDGTQATVTCPASATTSTTVTATLTDSTGATKTITSPLTFQTAGTKRAVTLALAVDGQTATGTVCTGVPAGAALTAVDAASGVGIKGLTAVFTRQAPGTLSPSTAAYRTTGTDGSTTANLSTNVATTYAATTTTLGMFNAASASGVAVTTQQCTADLTATPSTLTTWYGDTVTVTGSLRRTVATADDTAVPGAYLQLTVRTPDTTTATGRTYTVATTTTGTDGTFRASYRSTLAGALSVVLPATAGFMTTAAPLGTTTVKIPSTTLTASSSPAAVAYGGAVTVTGTLLKVTDTTAALAGATVSVRVTPASGITQTVAYGSVAANGSYTITTGGRVTGTISVAYAGSSGQPAATATAGSLTVTPWTPAVSLRSSSSTVTLGGYVDVSGSATKTYGSTTETAKSLRLTLVLTPSSGAAPVVLSYVYTTSLGTFLTRVYPRASGTITAVVTGVPGYQDGTSNGVPVAVV